MDILTYIILWLIILWVCWPRRKRHDHVSMRAKPLSQQKLEWIADAYPVDVPPSLVEDLNDKTLYEYIPSEAMWTSTFKCRGCGRPVTIDPEINEGWYVPACICRRPK